MYQSDQIMQMGGSAFSSTFQGRQVKVVLSTGETFTGKVSEIGLAANNNPSTGEHLPVTIRLENTSSFNLFDIHSIEILD